MYQIRETQSLNVAAHLVVDPSIGSTMIPSQQYIPIEEPRCRDTKRSPVHIPGRSESAGSGIVKFEAPAVGAYEDLSGIQQRASMTPERFGHTSRSRKGPRNGIIQFRPCYTVVGPVITSGD